MCDISFPVMLKQMQLSHTLVTKVPQSAALVCTKTVCKSERIYIVLCSLFKFIFVFSFQSFIQLPFSPSFRCADYNLPCLCFGSAVLLCIIDTALTHTCSVLVYHKGFREVRSFIMRPLLLVHLVLCTSCHKREKTLHCDKYHICIPAN